MRILAFDCAGAGCAAAVRVGSETIVQKRVESERGHARLLMPLLQEVSAEAGLILRDFDRFAVTTGPGSFTGIRVALATARGLALGTGKPAVGIDVFTVLAAQAAEAGVPAPRLLLAVESRRAECFLQLVDRTGKPLGPPTMLAPDGIPGWLGPGPVAVAGDGAGKALPALPQATDLGVRVASPSMLARLGAEQAPGEAPPRPFYLRTPDAIPGALRRPGGSFVKLDLTAAMTEVAAALHRTAGLPESWDAAAFAELLRMPATEGCLAMDSGTPVGVALWRVVAGEAELLTIAVAPERRRQGVGRFLLTHALEAVAARGACRIVLEVAVDNQPASTLYGAFGFVPRGWRPGYYRTDSGLVDARILVLDDLGAHHSG